MPKPQKKRLVRHVLWTAFKRMLMTLGALMLFSVIISSVLTYRILNQAVVVPTLPEKFVLYLPLEEDFPEYRKVEFSHGLGRNEMTMRELIDVLDRSATDARVKGLVVDLQGGHLNMAHIEELRAAILRFHAAGKFTHIYGATYGTPGRGLGLYYLASAFDEIWMQPMGELSIAGIRAEMPFVRAALEKIGVQPQFFARKEYKSLFESFTSTEMSPQSREMLTGLIGDLADYLMQGIAQKRKIAPEDLKAIVNRGLYIDQEAVDAGLVDHLGDYEVLREAVDKAVTGSTKTKNLFVDMDSYAHVTPPRRAANGENQPAVALIYIRGAIMASSRDGDAVSAEDVAKNILDAAASKDIKTIVLRIDSPGGSPAASETIRQAVLRAKSRGKKVVVSMGATAASGGYWVAAPADRIFALPGTLTGSIGVAGGKFALNGMWDKIGVKWDGVQYGDNAGVWSFNEPFSKSGTALINRTMDVIYDGFIARVAEGRNMTVEQVDAVAGGRVWTGRQAVEKGLVDELGGLDTVLDYVAKDLDVSDRRSLRVVVLPRPMNPVERLIKLIGKRVSMNDDLKALAEIYAQARHADEMTVWTPLVIR